MTLMQARPASLESRARDYERSAQAILAAAEELDGLVFEQRSDAISAVDERSRDLSRGIRTAQRRYAATATAISTFAVEIAALQHQHEEAESEARHGSREAEHAGAEVERLQREIRVREAAQAAPQVIGNLEQELSGWQSRERWAHGVDAEAREQVRRLEERFEEAAQRAIGAIDTAISVGADTIGDHIGRFVEDLQKVFVDIRRWVDDVVRRVIDGIDRFLDAVVPLVLLALLTVLALNLVVSLGLALTLVIGPLGLLVIPLGMIAVLLGAGTLLSRPLSDILAPDPEIRVLTEENAKKRIDPRPATIGTVFDEAREVDGYSTSANGLPERSVVGIERIVGADGDVSYRVILPSTQDWQALAPSMSETELSQLEAMKDQGATNDVDSNLALMLFPELRTQYERAVLAAMAAEGIRPGPDGDPVMLVGFSQGGIMAGHLAANRSDAYNFQAIMVAGAPIDHMNIPSTTTVISVQHNGDPVAMLDYGVRPDQAAPHQGDRWMTIVQDAPGSPSAIGDIHNAQQYSTTLGEHLTEVVVFDPRLVGFFPGAGGTSTSTRYEWHE